MIDASGLDPPHSPSPSESHTPLIRDDRRCTTPSRPNSHTPLITGDRR